MRLIHLPVVKIDIPVRTAYNKAIAAATPEMKMTGSGKNAGIHHKVVES